MSEEQNYINTYTSVSSENEVNVNNKESDENHVGNDDNQPYIDGDDNDNDNNPDDRDYKDQDGTEEPEELQEDSRDDDELNNEVTESTKKKKNIARDRIKDLVNENKSIRQEVDELKNYILEQNKKNTPSDKNLNEKPDPDKYPEGEWDDNYVKDSIAYEENKERLKIEKLKTELKNEINEENKWVSHHNLGRINHEDYDEIIREAFNRNVFSNMSSKISNLISDDPNASDICYYLANNRNVAQQIFSSDDTKASYEIGLLSKELSGNKQSKKTSKAPMPPLPERKIKPSNNSNKPSAEHYGLTEEEISFMKFSKEMEEMND